MADGNGVPKWVADRFDYHAAEIKRIQETSEEARALSVKMDKAVASILARDRVLGVLVAAAVSVAVGLIVRRLG